MFLLEFIIIVEFALLNLTNKEQFSLALHIVHLK